MGQVGPEEGTHNHRGHQEAGPESSHLPLEQEERNEAPSQDAHGDHHPPGIQEKPVAQGYVGKHRLIGCIGSSWHGPDAAEAGAGDVGGRAGIPDSVSVGVLTGPVCIQTDSCPNGLGGRPHPSPGCRPDSACSSPPGRRSAARPCWSLHRSPDPRLRDPRSTGAGQ